jgi:hypothetical protein
MPRVRQVRACQDCDVRWEQLTVFPRLRQCPRPTARHHLHPLMPAPAPGPYRPSSPPAARIRRPRAALRTSSHEDVACVFRAGFRAGLRNTLETFSVQLYADQLAGLSFPVVYVGVVECAPASPYTYSSTHRFPDERTPIEATPLSATSAELVLGLGLGLGLGSNSSSHAPSHAPLLLATLLSHNIPFPRVH